MVEGNHSLEPILKEIRSSQAKELKLPPCPACGRKLRTNVGFYQKKGKRVASIALWCSACTAATSAFDVDPIPTWAAPTDASHPPSGGG